MKTKKQKFNENAKKIYDRLDEIEKQTTRINGIDVPYFIKIESLDLTNKEVMYAYDKGFSDGQNDILDTVLFVTEQWADEVHLVDEGISFLELKRRLEKLRSKKNEE